jgi:hypothetical protein
VSVSDQIQKLEALLERVRRNKSAAPVRAVVASAEPIALDALPAVPPVVAPPIAIPPQPAYLSPFQPAATPPAPPVTPTPASVESAQPTAPYSEPPPPVATPSWQPEPGSAVQPRPTEPPTELSDDDLLEVTTMPPEAEISGTVDVSAATGFRSAPPEAQEVQDETAEEVPDEAPASSSRFRVSSSLDEALASAAESESDEEREIPVLTPPPESGPQEALPATGFESARLPDVDQLEADLDGPPSLGPTAEQLGETIELEAPRGPELEIDVTVVSEGEPIRVETTEDLEVTLPRASLPSGLYDVNVSAPPPDEVLTLEAPPAVPAAVTVPSQASDQPDRTHARPAVGATDVAKVSLVPPSAPRSFVELLDASLGL